MLYVLCCYKFHFLQKMWVITVIIITVINILISFSSSSALITSNLNLNTLKLVHAVSRHGERTPADTYPNDPYVNHTFFPYGWGQLTNKGKRQQYKLGRFLRKRYGTWLGKTYSGKIITAQSSDTDRAKMSAQLQLAALFPPHGKQRWHKKFDWQPIPVNYQPLDDDCLLLGRLPCPRYYEELKSVYGSKQEENLELLNCLTDQSGMLISNANDVQSLYSTLKAEEDFGLQLPEWTQRVYPHKLATIAEQSFIMNVMTKEMQRLKSGLFLKKIIQDTLDKVNNGVNEKKMYLYVGHDSTISNLLMALDAWHQQIPPYNAVVLIELHESATGQFTFEILFRNLTKGEPYLLQIAQCKLACPLQQLIDLTKQVVPVNYEKECRSKDANFVPPPPTSP